MSTLREADLSSILRFGLTYERINQFDIICLPENIARAESESELFDASDTITLSKLLKVTGIKCANSFDLNLEAQVLERRSDEKWFGVVYLRNNVAIPLFVTVLGNLISTPISDSIKGKEEPVSKVHIELKIERPANVTTIKYDGDPETLITILKGIEAENAGAGSSIDSSKAK